MKKVFLASLLFCASSDFVSLAHAAASETLTQATLQVEGMTCPSCEGFIRRGLMEISGVADVKASHKHSRVEIAFYATKVSLETLKAKIKELGYDVK